MMGWQVFWVEGHGINAKRLGGLNFSPALGTFSHMRTVARVTARISTNPSKMLAWGKI